jgi:hypothetical protein
VDRETATVVAAVVAAVASLVVAVVAAVAARRLAGLTARLADEGSARDARRDYEYEARKRLYAEFEPTLFHFFELADDAGRRVRSLARSSREGNLRPDGSGWLAREGYYFQSTVYLLLAPMAAVRILQRRLTAVDLAVEPRIDVQYRLLRLLYRTFTEDHALAREEARLPYDPDAADYGRPEREALLAGRPAVHVRQGLYAGVLDQVVEAFVVRDSAADRLISFGEFVEARGTADSRLHRAGPILRDLFVELHPGGRPVLWRVLVAQVLLYEALKGVRAGDFEIGRLPDLVPETSPALRAELEWRTPAELAAGVDGEAEGQAVEVARRYLTSLLAAADAEVSRYRTR